MSIVKLFSRYVGRAVLTMLLVTLVVSILVRLVPGNPAVNLLGQHASPQAVANLSRQMGLDHSIPDQIWSYFSGVLHGNLGVSLVQQGVSVSSLVFSAVGITLRLVLASVLLSVVVGVPIGLLAAVSKRRAVDVTVRVASVMLLASPPFFVGLVLVLVVSLQLHWLPAGGWSNTFGGQAKSLFLPAVALSCYLGPIVVRSVRQSALDAAQQPFVEAALFRVSNRRVVWAHILPNSMLPLITVIGVNIGWLISGAVVIEAVFNLPGLGTTLSRAVSGLDYTVIQGAAVVAALVVVVANLVADVLYTVVDPRTRRLT